MPEHARAHHFLSELGNDERVILAEQTLVEVYLLIRNPVVFPNPYSAEEATEVCQRYRRNPRWKLIECLPVMEEVWKYAAGSDFARRRIIDVRLALTLRGAGVDEFATCNVRDFQEFGFNLLWDPVNQ